MPDISRMQETAKEGLQRRAKALGLDALGVAPVDLSLRHDYYLRWIAEGRHGDMGWMARDNIRRMNPERVLPEARSIICAGINYWQPEPSRRGRIAKYALGGDYHKVVLKKLKQLCRYLREEHGGAQRPYVDTGPVLEKPVSMHAGLGWQGKSTILLNPEHGTWLFLGIIFTTVELEPDAAATERCGSCTRCIDACPTRAINAPFQLDARRCISYLTIEHKGSIPEEFRTAIGDRLYGCDECLDVCPWNKWARLTREVKFTPRPFPDLREMLRWDQHDLDTVLAGTAMRRIGLVRWKRNVCVVLGNIGEAADLPALTQAAADPDPIIAEHAQWALKRVRERLDVSSEASIPDSRRA
ncbi:tRNA epoxyqueuosine(34) reductase QueG [Ruficoccus sp. ZRK36]|uniref:tRNA epoxyqueuosine(34) reductase QueG n=1 Tax=Ruficoccus sp. ZRK36 TaxID=2866311 RepID=UPI002104852B|nr:tRNA epoxyqueuosine(34) reductase QueG [Ruficoccus sp. ZRK36]